MSRCFWMGLDPGAQGGIALIGEGLVEVLPIEKATELELYDWASAWALDIRLAVLEQVSSMPGQGLASTFKFGVSYGMLRMLLTALRVPWRTVTPPVWQRKMQCLSGGDKKITRAAAQRLFPRCKVTNAVADALLLAEYARRLG